jgi:ABC-2 type transport system ATP-binding protein
MTPLLDIQNLVKRYKQLTAVDKVSFTIEQGICFGLLGPNGAGKTTTIECIEDVIRPTEGAILYKGRHRAASFREEVGIQFQDTRLLDFLSVKETLATFKRLYQNTFDLEELLQMCHLGDIQDQMNDRISGGQKQRLLLALALINKPDLVFLDEPSTGLDPQSRRDLWRVIDTIKASGKTIVLTTHYMEEAQHLCDRVAIMDRGTIIAMDTPEELIRQHGGVGMIRLPIDGIPVALETLNVRHTVNGDHVHIHTANTNECLLKLIRAGINLEQISVRSPNLEDVFLNLTGRHLRE